MWVKQGILINGQFPGPAIDAVTNDNLIISVYNNLDEPFLLSWYRMQSPHFAFVFSMLIRFLCLELLPEAWSHPLILDFV